MSWWTERATTYSFLSHPSLRQVMGQGAWCELSAKAWLCWMSRKSARHFIEMPDSLSSPFLLLPRGFFHLIHFIVDVAYCIADGLLKPEEINHSVFTDKALNTFQSYLDGLYTRRDAQLVLSELADLHCLCTSSHTVVMPRPPAFSVSVDQQQNACAHSTCKLSLTFKCFLFFVFNKKRHCKN